MDLRTRFLQSLCAPLLAASLAQPVHAQSQTRSLRDLSTHKVSEQQLRSAVASRTLTWLTGNSANNDYISVGRMANFFGFVALRVSSGQSLTRAHVARDTLSVFQPPQVASLVAILNDQIPALEQTKDARIQMNRALEKLLVGEQVAVDDFLALGRTYGASEAELGRVIAQGFGDIAQTLTTEQRSRLAHIRVAHASGQPDTVPRSGNPVRLPDVDRKELVNLSARFLSWTTGSPEFNDFEVVGKPSQHFGFVNLRLASGHAVRRGAVAREVLDLLTPEQQMMLDVAVQQNVATFDDFLATRADLMRALEVALAGGVIDPETVRHLGAKVGEIEARMTLAQAKAMLNVRDALSETQLTDLVEMRAKYTNSAPKDTSRDPVELGRQLFAQCALCHASSRDDAIAPDLGGVIGRKIAADDGFDLYSPALLGFAKSHESWSNALLDDFLKSPRTLVPGTTMGFDGFDAPRDRAAILAYIATLD